MMILGLVVQLYLRDVFSTLSRSIKELKGFKRLSLKVGEEKNVGFAICEKDFSYLNHLMKPVLEPGTFEITLGSSSEDIKLRGSVQI